MSSAHASREYRIALYDPMSGSSQTLVVVASSEKQAIRDARTDMEPYCVECRAHLIVQMIDGHVPEERSVMRASHVEAPVIRENPISKMLAWGLGIGAVVAVGVTALVIVNHKKSSAPSGPPAAASLAITGSGTQTVPMTKGQTLNITLPANASWGAPATGPAAGTTGGLSNPLNVSTVNSPTTGNAPASLTYSGGGGTVIASWWDATGTGNTTQINITG